jgi:hypothetical protein
MTISHYIQRLIFIRNKDGLISTLNHILPKFIKVSRYKKTCSAVDIRNSHIKLVHDVVEFIAELDLGVKLEIIERYVKESKNELHNTTMITSSSFPSKWNSGRNLQIISYVLSRILKPSLIIETGTANGTSANSFAAAVRRNNFGKFITVDLRESELAAVQSLNRPFVNAINSSGTSKDLIQIISDQIEHEDAGNIFLHDSDHSYFGQFSDYKVANELNFSVLLSDDIDSSMAFIDFTKNFKSVTMFDEKKFIGAAVLKK